MCWFKLSPVLVAPLFHTYQGWFCPCTGYRVSHCLSVVITNLVIFQTWTAGLRTMFKSLTMFVRIHQAIQFFIKQCYHEGQNQFLSSMLPYHCCHTSGMLYVLLVVSKCTAYSFPPIELWSQ